MITITTIKQNKRNLQLFPNFRSKHRFLHPYSNLVESQSKQRQNNFRELLWRGRFGCMKQMNDTKLFVPFDDDKCSWSISHGGYKICAPLVLGFIIYLFHEATQHTSQPNRSTQCENPNENINSILNNNNHSMINVYCVFIEFSCNNWTKWKNMD